jgi:hypothetical protein
MDGYGSARRSYGRRRASGELHADLKYVQMIKCLDWRDLEKRWPARLKDELENEKVACTAFVVA